MSAVATLLLQLAAACAEKPINILCSKYSGASYHKLVCAVLSLPVACHAIVINIVHSVSLLSLSEIEPLVLNCAHSWLTWKMISIVCIV